MVYRNNAFRKYTRSKKPVLIGTGDTVDHHIKLLNGGGTSCKPPDSHVLPVAASAHDNLHQKGEIIAFGMSGYSKDDIAAMVRANIMDYLEEVHNIAADKLVVELLTKHMEAEGL